MGTRVTEYVTCPRCNGTKWVKAELVDGALIDVICFDCKGSGTVPNLHEISLGEKVEESTILGDLAIGAVILTAILFIVYLVFIAGFWYYFG